jgi:hypothetical protein
MKLDTEGHELEILSSEGFSKVKDKIDILVGEWHAWSKGNINLLISSLRDNGFDFDYINGTDAVIFVAKKK